MTNPTPHGQVPEALRLAEQYDHGDPAAHGNAWKAAVCTELRRQHARIAELEAELEAVGADRAMRAQAAPAAVAGPSDAVAYIDIGAGGYLDLGSDLSDEALMKLPKGRHMLAIVGTYGVDGYAPVAAPTTQPEQVAQGDALNNTVRVPLDSLHADAAYLIGRLQLGTMDGARVVEIIRERIEAAKAALAAQAKEGANHE